MTVVPECAACGVTFSLDSRAWRGGYSSYAVRAGGELPPGIGVDSVWAVRQWRSRTLWEYVTDSDGTHESTMEYCGVTHKYADVRYDQYVLIPECSTPFEAFPENRDDLWAATTEPAPMVFGSFSYSYPSESYGYRPRPSTNQSRARVRFIGIEATAEMVDGPVVLLRNCGVAGAASGHMPLADLSSGSVLCLPSGDILVPNDSIIIPDVTRITDYLDLSACGGGS